MKVVRLSVPLLPLVGVILMATCDGPLEPDEEARVGVVAGYGEPVVVAVPDTVQVGASFEVSIRTYGGGCYSQGGTTVRVTNLSADVTPYDIFHTGYGFCPDILRWFDHQVMMTLPESGVAQIWFHGRQMPEDSLVAFVREVVVK